jgi:hypothetical protein
MITGILSRWYGIRIHPPERPWPSSRGHACHQVVDLSAQPRLPLNQAQLITGVFGLHGSPVECSLLSAISAWEGVAIGISRSGSNVGVSRGGRLRS